MGRQEKKLIIETIEMAVDVFLKSPKRGYRIDELLLDYNAVALWPNLDKAFYGRKEFRKLTGREYLGVFEELSGRAKNYLKASMRLCREEEDEEDLTGEQTLGWKMATMLVPVELGGDLDKELMRNIRPRRANYNNLKL